MSAYTNRLLKYGVHGGVSYGALYYLSGGAKAVEVFGMEVPLVAAGLGFGIASCVATDVFNSWVLPSLNQDASVLRVEKTATSLAAGAGSMVGLAYVANKDLLQTPGMQQLAVAGALSEVVSQYAYEQLAQMFGIGKSDLVM